MDKIDFDNDYKKFQKFKKSEKLYYIKSEKKFYLIEANIYLDINLVEVLISISHFN